MSFELRQAVPDDSEALVALARSSADTGAIRVAPLYLRNPVEVAAALNPSRIWVVADTGSELIGGAQITLGETEVEGTVHPSATLSSLMVHPDHRRKGIAKALTQWRLERAGPDTVVAATIQSGNTASIANARSWASQIFGSLVIPVFRTRSGPADSDGLDIRAPQTQAEWEQAAAGLAQFEKGWNLRTPETAASLRERAERELASGERIQRYVVALDGGRVVGGLEIFEGCQLQIVVVEHLPRALRALNTLARVIPSDGRIREVSISRFWYDTGRADVGRALWAHARSAADGVGNAVTTQFDPRGPIGDVIRPKRWLPKGRVAVAVRSPVPLSEDRVLSPP
jgi:GNAT superfamily N-acetyltransferase